jgi:NAD(P)-dependent dehydrogenase (short-subunit alcohol dehydrogenase family)
VARDAAVAETITNEGRKARFAVADLSEPARLDDLVEQAGAVDILVNNAGISWPGPTADLDVATFDRLFAANVRAPYFLVAAAAALSTSAVRPARSACPGSPPRAPPRAPWRR